MMQFEDLDQKMALDNVAGERRLRETADERFERAVTIAVAMGNSLRAVADAAGVSHTQVARIAREHRAVAPDEIDARLAEASAGPGL